MKKNIMVGLMSVVLFLALPISILAEDGNNTSEIKITSTSVINSAQDESGTCISIPITTEDIGASSNYNPVDWTFYAWTPEVVGFFDYNGMYNVANIENNDSWELKGISIQRYDGNMNLNSTIKITAEASLFGNVTTDSAGNYYVVWGQTDTDDKNGIVLITCKYDYTGKLIGKCNITGFEAGGDDYWGTRIPFDAGNCALAINNGILVCNFAREMYSGHQSNYVYYIDCNTMNRVIPEFDIVPYVSHSFDQRVLPTSDGGFLVLNHGDAYERSFMISKVDSDLNVVGTYDNFHFREGSDRSHGYNETYAQLGGIAETNGAYIFLGSSEKTLSLSLAPTTSYCGHNEARDLFIQIFKKNFYEIYDNEENKFLVKGEVRKATGVRPESTENSLYLADDEVDYGIKWLTNYDEEHYAGNPHIVKVDNDKVCILWEKRSYSSSDIETYYAIINEDGTYSKTPTLIPNVTLAGNIPPVIKDGKIYWTTLNNGEGQINILTVSKELSIPTVNVSNHELGVKVAWNKIANAQGYYVYRKEENGVYKRIETVNNSETVTYIDTSVVSGKTYIYSVAAYSDNGSYVTEYSENGSVIKYIKAPNVTQISSNTSGIKIVWEKSAGAEMYRVFRKNSSGAWEKLADTTANSFVDKSVNDKCIYVYTIRCISADKSFYTSAYIKKGTSFTGLLKNGNKWVYVSNGDLNETYTGMGNNAYGMWYLKNGKIDTTYTGIVKDATGIWYVKNGKVDTSFSALYKYDGRWQYFNEGKLDATYTGMGNNAYGMWYLKNGKIDTTYTGIVKDATGIWYVKNGKVDTSFSALYKYDGRWQYFSKGKLNENYTGLGTNDYGTWYMKDGRIDTTVTGLYKADGKWLYFVNGKLNETYTGLGTNEYGTWYMKDGRIDTTVTGLYKADGKWLYFSKGKLNETYTGIATNDYGTWYMKNGRIDTTFSGTVTIDDETYTIKNGKVV